MSTIDLPLPPSVNRLWRSNRGRVHRAPRYLSWLKAAGWELVTQRPERLAGSVRVNISAGRPDRRRRDVDNLGKALLDLLTKHEVIQDDSCVVSITCGWDDDVAGGRVHVKVRRSGAPKKREGARQDGLGHRTLVVS
jgi:crossover junction endodeoxyribonuclease RusA